MNNCTLKIILISLSSLTIVIGLYLAYSREQKNIASRTLDLQDGSGSLKDWSFSIKTTIGVMMIIIGFVAGIYCLAKLPACDTPLKKEPESVSIHDDTTKITPSYPGNRFKEVPIEICRDNWTPKNVDFDRYNDGSPIKQAKTKEEWINCYTNGEGCWCYYNNDPQYDAIYGKVYNWYVIADKRGFIPKGWHVATLDDYKKMIYECHFQAPEMKSNTGWNSYQTGNAAVPNNSSGFNGLPGGMCSDNFDFSGVTQISGWWTISTYRDNSDLMYCLYLRNDDFLYWEPKAKGHGFYIRCVKD